MHVETPRTIPHRIIMALSPRNPRPQKKERTQTHTSSSHSPHCSSHSPSHHHATHIPHRPFCSNQSPSPSRSSLEHRLRRRQKTHSSVNLCEPSPSTMTIAISAALRRWLLEKGFVRYIKVVEAPPHPNALDIAKTLNVDTVTNAMVR